MNQWEHHIVDKVIKLIRGRGAIAVKRNDPFLTLLRVACLHSQFRVICVDWDA